jgi:hypothetical protein
MLPICIYKEVLHAQKWISLHYNVHVMKTRLQMVYSVIQYSDCTEVSYTFKIYRDLLCQISPDWDNKCRKVWIENHLHYKVKYGCHYCGTKRKECCRDQEKIPEHLRNSHQDSLVTQSSCSCVWYISKECVTLCMTPLPPSPVRCLHRKNRPHHHSLASWQLRGKREFEVVTDAEGWILAFWTMALHSLVCKN